MELGVEGLKVSDWRLGVGGRGPSRVKNERYGNVPFGVQMLGDWK